MAAVLAVCSAVCAALAAALLVDAVGRLRPGMASVKRGPQATWLKSCGGCSRRMARRPRRRGRWRCCAWLCLLPA